MTTISNLGILLQQGGNIRETQNVRQQLLEANQLAELQNQEKVRKQRATVEQSEDSENVKFDRNGREKRRRQYRDKSKSPLKDSSAAKEDNPEGKGSILDTIA